MIDNCLNWCAGEELEQEVAKKMIRFIIDEPDAKFFMCAQEDTNTTCANLPEAQEARLPHKKL